MEISIMGISTTGRIWVINDEFYEESKDYEFYPEDEDELDNYEESVKEWGLGTNRRITEIYYTNWWGHL